MKDSLQLLKILQGQLDACSKYLEIQKEKKDALVVGEIKKLDSIVKEEQSFLMKMESFDVKRDLILKKSGLRDITISEIIANHVEDELKEQYQEVLDRLSNVVENIKRANITNQRLLKERLSVVNNILTTRSKDETFTGPDDKDDRKFIGEKIKRA